MTTVGRSAARRDSIHAPLRANTQGLILAGGRARRLGGIDKGLELIEARPMVSHVAQTLAAQVAAVTIVTNRNAAQYYEFSNDVIADEIPDHAGPLAGIQAGLRHLQCNASITGGPDSADPSGTRDWLLVVPCDAVRLPTNLFQRLAEVAVESAAPAVAAHDGSNLIPVCALLHKSLLTSVDAAIEAGVRSPATWLASVGVETAAFTQQTAIWSINTPAELELAQRGLTRKPGTLLDRFGRRKRKLRLSLTDRCNLRCVYCMPERPEWLPANEQLDTDETFRAVDIMVRHHGIRELRLTGGEPLLRKDLETFTRRVSQLRSAGLERISLTTNAIGLGERCTALAEAGIDDINISLDAVSEAGFARMTRRFALADVVAGIEAAVAAGISVKLNAVIVKGLNDNEILPLADFALRHNVELRFIEFMPLDGRGSWSRDRVVSEHEILDTLRSRHRVTAVSDHQGAAPATRYRINDQQHIGIIPTVTRPFCGDCDRVRITSDGQLLNCLFSTTGLDLRGLLRGPGDDKALATAIDNHVWNKERGYVDLDGYVSRPITMHAIGG